MNFVPCVTWIQRGVAKESPDEVELTKDELEKIIKGAADDLNEADAEAENEGLDSSDDDSESGKKSSDVLEMEQGDNEDADFMNKYDLNNYDKEETEGSSASVLAGLGSITCYADSKDDPYITLNDDQSDNDDEDDRKIKSTDNLIAVGHVDQDHAILEFHVYNEEEEQLYVHHDIFLPSFPLCIEWLDYDPDDLQSGNFIAVGSMNPHIDIWDVDIVNTLEPAFTLGDKKHKKSSKKKIKNKGHTDSVLSLAWNKLFRNVLASGSADFRILLWDLKEKKYVTKIKDHSEKVQTLQWHPFESQTLLSGSYDHTVKLFDCRDVRQGHKTWTFDSEIEKVLWNHFDPYHFLVSSEKGYVYYMDVRSEVPVFNINAHSDAITGMSLSSNCPGCLVTVSSDKSFKVWDIANNQAECVVDHNFKLGEIICVSSCPNSPFVFAAGGDNKENNFVVWDIRQFAPALRRFEARQLLSLSSNSQDNRHTSSASAVENETSDGNNGET